MKNVSQKGKFLTLNFTALLLLLLFGLLSLSFSVSSNKKGSDDDKVNKETLLPEKLVLDKQISNLGIEMQTVKGNTKQSEGLLFNANKDSNQKAKGIKDILQDKKKVNSADKLLDEIQKLKADLKKQKDSFNLVINRLIGEKLDLAKKVLPLQNEILILNEQVKLYQTVVADNYRIETKNKKKNRLTILAAKTKIIQIGFDIPDHINSDIKLRIITQNGKVLTGEENGVTSGINNNFHNLTAGLSPEIEKTEIFKRVEKTFLPHEKLQEGIYKIEILNKDGLIGSCQFRLK